MKIHDNAHPQSGQTVTISAGSLAGQAYRLEDWWDRVSGVSWMHAEGNPAALTYAVRRAFDLLPMDNKVVYGKIGSFGHIVHTSEIAAPNGETHGD